MDTSAFPYLALLICGLLVVFALVAIASSYFMLVALDKQRRTCPHCGRKGAGRLVDSEMVDSRTFERLSSVISFKKGKKVRRQMSVTEEVYEDLFECENCQHRWTKVGVEREWEPLADKDSPAPA